MSSQLKINDTRTIVERKLSEVYTEVTLSISFDYYDQFVEEAYEHLLENGVQIDKCTISENPAMMDNFERKIKEWIKDLDYDELEFCSPPTDSIFRTELKEAARVREIQRKEEERQRLAAEAAQRKLEASMLEQIPVTKKNHAKALAILQAAGLTK